jgi:hypothetical protein
MIDLTKFSIGLDVWEGSLDIDENVLKQNGVKFLIIRMNDTVGSLHLDTNFKNQWNQASGFGRAPYFVVSSWNSAAIQSKFILDNMPQGCKTIFLDVELHYNETPGNYSILLNQMITTLKNAGLKVVIYTGAWFAQYVNPWPSTVEYWLAAYPYAAYPPSRINLTWDQAKKTISTLFWPTSNFPGRVILFQFTGDRWILPGCANRAMDVNLISNADYELLFGNVVVEPTPIPVPQPVPVPDPVPVFKQYQAKVTADSLYIRSGPASTFAVVGGLVKNQIVTVLSEQNGWAKIDKGWCSMTYLQKQSGFQYFMTQIFKN